MHKILVSLQILLQRYEKNRKVKKRMWKVVNICLLVATFLLPADLFAQSDSIHFSPDSTASKAVLDTVRTDSTAKKSILPTSPNALKSKVHYQATDSIVLDVSRRQAKLYTDGVIQFDGMELKSDDVRVDFNQQTLHAQPVLDSNGAIRGHPFFKQEDAEYIADTITFNYGTKKGLISGVITQEGEGFLHGQRVKKMNDSVMYMSSGQYTTCNYAHPHFAVNFTKSKVIAGDKLITGPAYVTIEDVPTPLALPFAFFPITHGRSSGILIPSYGWMNNRGFYLKDGGYYFAMNDHVDLSLIGDIFSNLSWAAEARSNYYRRYRYKGDFDIRYGITREGLEGDTNTFNKFSDFKITWKHEHDAKANPRSRFSANVNLQSRNYSKNTLNRNDYFNSTTTSSISYTAQLGKTFNLAASMRESYNVQTGVMDFKLPSISLSSTTIYPLRRKLPSGGYRWYENISLSYSLSADNNLSSQDSDLFKQQTLNRMQYGVQHSVPISSSIKVLKYFNWTNSASYNERWHWTSIQKSYDSLTNAVTIDTLRGFRTNREVSFSSSLSIRIYGTFSFKRGPIKALRHVINPSVSFNYRPDFGSERLGYWRSYTDNTGYVHRYSIFEQSLYGGPADGRSGQLRFNIGNNLEMKVAAPKDTVNGIKKITLLENLNLSASYDLAKDSLQWSDLSVSGRTTLFKNLILNYAGSFSPYYIDSAGRKHDQFVWDMQDRLLQKNNSTWSGQLAFNLNNNTFKSDGKKRSSDQGQQIVAPIMQSPYNYNPALLMGTYADFSMPWNLSINYTVSYVSTFVAAQYNFKNDFIQTLSVSGNVNLTPNWRVAISTGYDFANKGMSYTSIDLYRDLHCWEMRFNWVPFGYYKSWNFQINIKASALKDLKYEKRQTYLDNQGYYSY